MSHPYREAPPVPEVKLPRIILAEPFHRLVQLSKDEYVLEMLDDTVDAMGVTSQYWKVIQRIHKDATYTDRFGFTSSHMSVDTALWLCATIARLT